MADDPFTQTLNKLWDLLESHEEFTNLVRLGNRVKLTAADPDPYKPRAQSADLPEVRVEPNGGQAELFATSTSTRAVQNYAILVTTGDLRVNKLLFPLKWELMKALSKSGDNLGLAFVKKVRIGELTESTERKGAPGTRGWSGTITVTVEMWFPNSQLQA
jgi:hypothetical protein